MERRRHPRVRVNVPIGLPRFTLESPFPGLKQLLDCRWKCRDISCAGMLLEARSEKSRKFTEYLRWLLGTFFTGIKEQGRADIFYPILPPERLQVFVEIEVPNTRKPFVYNGSMAWFKPYGRGTYRMGLLFDDV